MERPDPPGPYQAQPPPGWQQPPPAWQQQPGWYPPPLPPPQNGLAIAAMICSGASLAFLILLGLPTFGFSFIVSIPLGIAGLVCGLLGRQKVDRGETPHGRDLAQAGFVLGIVSLALHALAIVVALALIGLLIEAVDHIDVPDPDQTTPSAL